MQDGAAPAPMISARSSALFGRGPLTIGITGGSGFVGRALITQLVSAGHTVRLATRDAGRADALLPLSQVEIWPGNVHDTDFLSAVFAGCDAVVHLVGILNERGFSGSGFRRAHVGLTAAVLRAMQRSGVRRLLHMSALNADPAGRSHYLRTKGEAEALLRAQASIQWTIFRPSVIFGPDDSLTLRFAALLRLSRGVLPLARAGARFAPIHVGDVALAFVRALNDPACIGRTYELCGPEVLTLADLVREVARAARLPCHIVPVPDAIAWLQAGCMELLPGKPFSLDNMRSLLTDSVCRDCACPGLGILPRSFRASLPQWLAPRPAPGRETPGRSGHA